MSLSPIFTIVRVALRAASDVSTDTGSNPTVTTGMVGGVGKEGYNFATRPPRLFIQAIKPTIIIFNDDRNFSGCYHDPR